MPENALNKQARNSTKPAQVVKISSAQKKFKLPKICAISAIVAGPHQILRIAQIPLKTEPEGPSKTDKVNKSEPTRGLSRIRPDGVYIDAIMFVFNVKSLIGWWVWVVLLMKLVVWRLF